MGFGRVFLWLESFDSGFWKNHVAHGAGLLFRSDGIVVKGNFENHKLVGKANFIMKGNPCLSLEMKKGLLWGEAKFVLPMPCHKRAKCYDLKSGENEGRHWLKAEIELSGNCYLTEDIMAVLKDKKDIKGKQIGMSQSNNGAL
jgi:hypothetical protein